MIPDLDLGLDYLPLLDESHREIIAGIATDRIGDDAAIVSDQRYACLAPRVLPRRTLRALLVKHLEESAHNAWILDRLAERAPGLSSFLLYVHADGKADVFRVEPEFRVARALTAALEGVHVSAC